MNPGIVAWVFAHPDDETFSSSVTIMHLVRHGGTALLLTATPGDAGKTGRLGPMTKSQLALKRKTELQTAADLLGISSVTHLDYSDGQLDTVKLEELSSRIQQYLNQHHVQVVVTFPEDGISGHRDHVAIHKATLHAVTQGNCPTVRKLYFVTSRPLIQAGYAPTVTVDVTADWPQKLEALKAHESQILSVERVFGDVQEATVAIPQWAQQERFTLVWKEGDWWPKRTEMFLTDGLE